LHANRGEPLAPDVRRPYEGYFDADLSAMRIHTGDSADAAAQSISATAFARGNDVYFQNGRFDPAIPNGGATARARDRVRGAARARRRR
jgi:hypothetical protein